MLRKLAVILTLLASVLLAACTPSEQAPSETTETGPDHVAQAPEAEDDRTDIQLKSVRKSDIEKLEGELGCTFIEMGNSLPLLIARANVSDSSRPTAVANNNGTGLLLESEEEGGFARLEQEGGTFSNEALTITIDIIGLPRSDPLTDQLVRTAQVTFNNNLVSGHTMLGGWICGP